MLQNQEVSCPQIAVLNARLETANINKTRIENLIKDNAGTQKQLDEIKGEIDVIKQQIRSIEIQNAPVVNELKNIDVQIRQIEDQIEKSKIINPIGGTVLVKYAEPNEVTAFGKPLYKIADLSNMQLRVFVSETQLSGIKIGQEASVKIDSDVEMKNVHWNDYLDCLGSGIHAKNYSNERRTGYPGLRCEDRCGKRW